MPIFKCSQCGCVENTALSNYWWNTFEKQQKPLCSECDPEIGKWHGKFEKADADAYGYEEGRDGFLYGPDEKRPPGA